MIKRDCPFLKTQESLKKSHARNSFFRPVKFFFLFYFEGILVFSFFGLILTICLFSWIVSESSWSLAAFERKYLHFPEKGIVVYLEGAVEKKGVYFLKKNCSTAELLALARLEKGAYPWKKVYKKTLKESSSLYIPRKEEEFSSF